LLDREGFFDEAKKMNAPCIIIENLVHEHEEHIES